MIGSNSLSFAFCTCRAEKHHSQKFKPVMLSFPTSRFHASGISIGCARQQQSFPPLTCHGSCSQGASPAPLGESAVCFCRLFFFLSFFLEPEAEE